MRIQRPDIVIGEDSLDLRVVAEGQNTFVDPARNETGVRRCDPFLNLAGTTYVAVNQSASLRIFQDRHGIHTHKGIARGSDRKVDLSRCERTLVIQSYKQFFGRRVVANDVRQKLVETFGLDERSIYACGLGRLYQP